MSQITLKIDTCSGVEDVEGQETLSKVNLACRGFSTIQHNSGLVWIRKAL